MSFTRKAIQAALALLVIAGCSDDSSPFLPTGGSEGPAPANLLPITATNARDVAGEAYLAAVKSIEIADIAATVGQSAGGGVTKPAGPSLSVGGITELVLTAPFGPTVLPCTSGGTVTISGDLASPTELSAGDTVNLLYEACNTNGEVINGSVSSTVEQYREDPVLAENFVLSLQLEIANFQVTANGLTETTNGDAGVIVDTLGAPTTLAASAAGSSTTFDDNNGSTTLTNYATRETFSLNGEVFEFDVDTRGTVDSTSLDSPVTYSTPVRLVGVAFQFPSSGELLVTGQNSSVRVVALDSTNVRLDIDSDGNGEVDVSVETTWTDITG